MGVINPFDVGKLVTPLKQYQLVQAVAKVQEYQTLVDERSELKKPIHTLEGKQTLFIECLRKKTKSWYETLTPLPWKKVLTPGTNRQTQRSMDSVGPFMEVMDWIESGILVVEEGVMAREEEHRNKEEAVEEGMVTQDEIISIEDERREGESSSEATMIGEGQDDILSIDEECPRDRESSTDNMLNEKEKPFTEMKTSTDPQNLSVQVKVFT
ncbi:hypothetical protein BSL78_23864 [Apostichopus japonicus]|uniref:Uncharacterized protein n=1 Tax=Stichopus japonicus TaxID=307972 RepID=A0A2G8JU55_STIJA|nr:hypothetical protein BSL78_23864 [Apostichopus japonicus]